jgi:dTDP-D-glucose 4,6-dehydratase
MPIHDFSARQEVSNVEFVTLLLPAMDLNAADWIEHSADRPSHDRRYHPGGSG